MFAEEMVSREGDGTAARQIRTVGALNRKQKPKMKLEED